MNSLKKYFIPIAVLSILFFTNQAVSDSIKTAAIKPLGSAALSDEQQGILAVRQAKASVVDIIGVTNQQPSDNISGVATDAGSPSVIFGTGFVLEKDGIIVSNNHVVGDDSLSYWVILADGSEYPAKILNLDKYDDVALLKINATNLTPAKLGDSSGLETGQTVFAIGNSLGEYQYTVSRGVISATNRSVDETSFSGNPAGRLHNMIQTDAAINPGNSGGPLVNLNGEVVGMNTLIDTGGSSLGFAVAVNTIKDALSQIKTFGKVSRPFMGVKFVNIDPSIQIAKQLPINAGALISEVIANSPAALAGLKAGDIITAVNKIAITPNAALDNLVDDYQSGMQITLAVLRQGQTLNLTLILGQLP